MSTGPIPRKGVTGHAKRKRMHEILGALVDWTAGGGTHYKGDGNYATAPNTSETTGGEWPIEGLDPNKFYKITHMRVEVSVAPGGVTVLTILLRQNGINSTNGVVTITGLNTSGEAAFQDVVTFGAYVTVKVTQAGGVAQSAIKVFLTVEEI